MVVGFDTDDGGGGGGAKEDPACALAVEYCLRLYGVSLVSRGSELIRVRNGDFVVDCEEDCRGNNASEVLREDPMPSLRIKCEKQRAQMLGRYNALLDMVIFPTKDTALRLYGGVW